MKLAVCLMALLMPITAFAADEKIDPATYICAELVAASVDGSPPLFEGLQLDGYAAAKAGQTVADPNIMEAMLIAVSDSCASQPAEKALTHWQAARKAAPVMEDSPWRADKTTCADYQANQEDGSGFVIWLDGYQRAKNGKTASVFTDQATLDAFLDACAKNPQALMIDVMTEKAR